MKIELGKTYRNRDNTENYKIICIDKPGMFPVVAYNTFNYDLCSRKADGSFSVTREDISDFVEEVVSMKIVTGWTRCRAHKGKYHFFHIVWDTKEEAMKADLDAIPITTKVTFKVPDV